MNLPLPLFGMLTTLLLLLAWRRPQGLFLLWPVVLLLFPSTRTNLGGAPVYWYDAVSIAILCRLYLSTDLSPWPATVPRWHWWFVASGVIFGTLVPLARYGPSLEMGWIFAHAALAWMAFAIGIALSRAANAASYRAAMLAGLLLALAGSAALALLQFGNEAMAARINQFYFHDMQGHLVLLEDVGARISASRVNGPHGDPNTFGGTTALVCAVVLLLLPDRLRRLAPVIIGLAALVVGATVSRQVLVAAVFAFAAAFLLGSGRMRVRIVGAMSALVVLGLLSGVAASWAERLSRWQGGVGQDVNVVGRIVIGPQRLLAVIGADPTVLVTGVGLDVQKLVKKAADKKSDVGMYQLGFVSNSFLLPLYYLGITGFVLTLLFWFWTLRRALTAGSARALHTGAVVLAMLLIASDNYAFIVEVSVAMLFLLAALVGGRHPVEMPARPSPLVPQYANLVS